MVVLTFAIVFITACSEKESYTWNPEETQEVHKAMKVVTDVMLNDVLPPPVASRVYLYAFVAAYKSAVHSSESYRSQAGQLRDLEPGLKPDSEQVYDFEV